MTNYEPTPQGEDFPPGLSVPARRALAGAGYTQLSQLTEVSAREVGGLHGMGPKGIRMLREALTAKGLAFGGVELQQREPQKENNSNANAEQFVQRLESYRSPGEKSKTGEGQEDEHGAVMGVRIGQVFNLAKEFIDMPPGEIEKLLESPIYEVKAGGLSIMGKQAERRKTPESRKKELYELYMKHIESIDSWQLVDISCHKVIGGYLVDKPRDVLYTLAHSHNWCERRTAVYSTLMFMRTGDLDDAFKISEILLYDDEHFIRTAVGGILREAGKKDQQRLLGILDRHAATMPRVTLRYAIEHLHKEVRDHYLSVKKT